MTTSSAGEKTILVVEDEAAVRTLIIRVLQREGYRVVAAGDGREMLDQVRAGLTPDLIVLDMVLPSEDGWQLLERRRQEPALAAVPVLIVTGLVGSPEWAAALGAAGYLEKPLELAALLAEVRRCCDQPGERPPAAIG
jgi:CheY-like chemotaxis protein